MRSLLETLAVLGILVMFGVLLYFWPNLPDFVPRHFGISGRPDSWGGKANLYVLPSVGFATYLLLTVVSRYPNSFHYPCAITEENRERQAELAKSFILWLKAEIVWVFAYLEWKSILVAFGRAEGLGATFLPVSLVVITGTVGVYFWRARQYA